MPVRTDSLDPAGRDQISGSLDRISARSHGGGLAVQDGELVLIAEDWSPMAVLEEQKIVIRDLYFTQLAEIAGRHCFL
jgi:hypothetical protein